MIDSHKNIPLINKSTLPTPLTHVGQRCWTSSKPKNVGSYNKLGALFAPLRVIYKSRDVSCPFARLSISSRSRACLRQGDIGVNALTRYW